MTVTADNLSDAIAGIMDKYAVEVNGHVKEAVSAATKAGVKAVKSGAAAKFDGTGRYAAGWTSRYETDRFSAQGIIYNKDVPGLPHLLEHGHAKRGGGRVPGRMHIAPVEEAVEGAVTRAIEMRLSKL